MKLDVQSRIIFNGKEYGSPDELPPEARQAWEEALSKGLTSAHTDIVLNGRRYSSGSAPTPGSVHASLAATVSASASAGTAPRTGRTSLDLDPSALFQHRQQDSRQPLEPLAIVPMWVLVCAGVLVVGGLIL